MGAEKTLKKTSNTFNGLMLIGFLGIVWLMIYGNLSGNMGLPRTSTSFTNETIALIAAGEIPATADDRVNGALSDVVITNESGGEVISSGNYTITGVVINVSIITAEYNDTNVNVSATVSYDTDINVATESVITNLTQGARTFFGFSNTLFLIIAIVLLITVLLGLLFLVMNIAKVSKGKSSKFSE